MSSLKRVFEFYIFSNIHVGLATFCLTKITLLSFGSSSNLIPFFVFTSTILSYNFLRFYRIYEIQNWYLNFYKSAKPIILGLNAICLFSTIYLFFMLEYKTWLVLIPFILCTVFYIIPIRVTKDKKISLRGVSFLKLFLIGITWAGVTVLVPAVNNNIPIEGSLIVVTVQRFFLVVAITIPFDIRDMNHDHKSLKTTPQTLGVHKSKLVGMLFLMSFLGLEFFTNSMEQRMFRIDLIVALISLLLLVRASEDQHRYYSAFFVESVPIIWFLLVYFLIP